MDHSSSTASPLKSSKRLSRLPTLKPASFSAGLDDRSLIPSPAKASSAIPSPVKPSLPQPTGISKPTGIQKPTPITNRSSIAGTPSRLPPPKTTTHRTSQSVHHFDGRATVHGTRPDSRSSTRLARPESRSSSRLGRPSPSKVPVPHSLSRAEDAADQLGSLDGFRASSRQSFRAESPILEVSDALVDNSQTTPNARKSSRPSLSDRTVESISRLPPTPATERRRSSFFGPTSPMGPPSRPASALSMTMRPGSSDSSTSFTKSSSRLQSPMKRAPMSAIPSNRISVDYSAAKSTPSKRSVSAATPRTVQPTSRTLPQSNIVRPSISKLPSATAGPRVAGTPGVSRTSIPQGGAFGASVAKRKAAPPTTVTKERAESPPPPAKADTKVSSSSAALRDQIAKAKAAKRATATSGNTGLPQLDGTGDYEFDLSADPFNAKPKDNKGLLLKRIDAARAEGRLNIAGMGLKNIPDEVLRMYDAEEMEKSKMLWSETVDLTRLIAADNELEEISDDIFPDIDAETASDEEEAAKGLQFRGLEMLDLHGNMLTAIPVGLRRLERLTVVNLSHNKLNNAACEVFSQLESLKELRLGHNNLAGYLPQGLSRLRNLRTLDLQSNKLLSLPEGIRELVNLQVLNVSNNQLTGLPMDALEALPLTELSVANNAMVGALFPFSVSGMPQLQSLDVSNNSLASLAFSESLSLPALKTLNITSNRIVALPDMTGWAQLASLAAADNKISELPVGFSALKEIRHADLTGNEISKLPYEVGLMASLETLKIAANPLKERKLLNMPTAELKRDLSSRLKSDVKHSTDEDFEDEGIDIQSPANAHPWQLQSGVLDLTGKELVNDDADELRSFLGANPEVRELVLAKNLLSMIPFELSMAQNLRVLDLSNCSLGGEYLTEVINFQYLQELNISGNRISSWDPLLQFFQAPRLTTLNVSNNRLVGSVPALRDNFPDLKVLHVRDNKVDAVSAEALEGLQSADLSNNNIGYLPPEIGLLWDKGFKGFNVSGNAFRVPNYRVLEKGTEATLAWLRTRIAEGDGLGEGSD